MNIIEPKPICSCVGDNNTYVEMINKGGVGKYVYVNRESENKAVEVCLYQCPKCKEVILN